MFVCIFYCVFNKKTGTDSLYSQLTREAPKLSGQLAYLQGEAMAHVGVLPVKNKHHDCELGREGGKKEKNIPSHLRWKTSS